MFITINIWTDSIEIWNCNDKAKKEKKIREEQRLRVSSWVLFPRVRKLPEPSWLNLWPGTLKEENDERAVTDSDQERWRVNHRRKSGWRVTTAPTLRVSQIRQPTSSHNILSALWYMDCHFLAFTTFAHAFHRIAHLQLHQTPKRLHMELLVVPVAK